MKSTWTKGLDKTLEGEMKASFLQGALLRRRMAVLVREKIATNQTASISAAGYDNPNWAYKQADSVGYQRALQEMLSLLDED